MKKNEVINLNKIKDDLLKEINQDKMEFQKEIIKKKMIRIEELESELKDRKLELDKIIRGEINYDSLYNQKRKSVQFRENGYFRISGEL